MTELALIILIGAPLAALVAYFFILVAFFIASFWL